MEQGFKIAILNTGGPNNKPLEYGSINEEQLQFLIKTVKEEPLYREDPYKHVYDFVEGEDGFEKHFPIIFNLPAKTPEANVAVNAAASTTEPEEVPLQKSHILDEINKKIVEYEDSRFESSVQHDETDIYNPENLIKFIANNISDIRPVRRQEDMNIISSAVNNHLKKILDNENIKPAASYHWDGKGDIKASDAKIFSSVKELGKKEALANEFFKLGYMVNQTRAMFEFSGLIGIVDENKKKALMDELKINGKEINTKKENIIKQLTNEELDIIMLIECQGVTKISEVPEKFKLLEPKKEEEKKEDKVCQILINKSLLNESVPELIEVDGLEDVAESLFVEFKGKDNQNCIVGVIHYSSFEHKPFKVKDESGRFEPIVPTDKNGDKLDPLGVKRDGTVVDLRVDAILSNLEKIKNNEKIQGKKIIVGMDTNSARLLKSDIENEENGFKLLSPGDINELMGGDENRDKKDDKFIKKKATSTTIQPTVIKARTEFQPQPTKANLLDCCSKDIIVGLGLDRKFEGQIVETKKNLETQSYEFFKRGPLEKAIEIGEDGKIVNNSEDIFKRHKIPNPDYPFDHFIVTTNTPYEELKSEDKINKLGTASIKNRMNAFKKASGQNTEAPEPVAPQPVAPQPVAPQPVAPQQETPQTSNRANNKERQKDAAIRRPVKGKGEANARQALGLPPQDEGETVVRGQTGVGGVTGVGGETVVGGGRTKRRQQRRQSRKQNRQQRHQSRKQNRQQRRQSRKQNRKPRSRKQQRGSGKLRTKKQRK